MRKASVGPPMAVTKTRPLASTPTLGSLPAKPVSMTCSESGNGPRAPDPSPRHPARRGAARARAATTASRCTGFQPSCRYLEFQVRLHEPGDVGGEHRDLDAGGGEGLQLGVGGALAF